MKIGKIDADLRKEKEMSQMDLASKTGTPQVIIEKHERGDAWLFTTFFQKT